MQQKVLVIEDSKTGMKIMRSLIQKAGLEPVCASSLTQARMLFANDMPEHYLCALVDYNLPDAPDGEAINFAIDAFVPTIVITGRLDDATREKVLAMEVVDYIPKQNAQVYEYLSRLMARLEKNKHIGVIVVDDSRLSRMATASLLQRHNYMTYEAADGKECLELLDTHPSVKLVMTDYNMPTMDGVELVVAIRQKYSKEDLAVIGISGAVNSSVLSSRFLKSGANDYLQKDACHEEFFCRVTQNIEFQENVAAIHRAANTDYLTQLPNRRAFFSELRELAAANHQHWSVAILDLDKFKQINDSHGHDGGDAVLKFVARLLEKRFHHYQLCRFGGEEFALSLPDIDLAQARDMLDSFRDELASSTIVFNDIEIPCTVSIGLATLDPKGLNASLKVADEHLYHAKQNGRNQVSC